MALLDPVYEHENDWVTHRYHLASGNVLRFCARDIRKEKTGVHANVSININWVSLAWSNFNIEKDEDRVRLANSAYKHLDGEAFQMDRGEWPSNQLKHALDIFCMGLWDEAVGVIVGGQMAGRPDIMPARRLIADYVVKDGGTILFAPPGQGKSYTALLMAVSCEWGMDKLWPLEDAWRPLYINVERSALSMAARLALVNKALDLPPEAELPFLNARGKSLPDIYEAARRTMKAEGCQWVIYDSISRMGLGGLKEDDTANKSMDMLNALSGTWVALGHTSRAGAEDDGGSSPHVFGSMMFDAAADITVLLRSQDSAKGDETGVSLEVQKANDGPHGSKTRRTHVFEWAESGLAGVRTANSGEFAELDAASKVNKEQEIRRMLLERPGRTRDEIAEALGCSPQHAGRILGKMEGVMSREEQMGRAKFVRYALRSDREH